MWVSYDHVLVYKNVNLKKYDFQKYLISNKDRAVTSSHSSSCREIS